MITQDYIDYAHFINFTVSKIEYLKEKGFYPASVDRLREIYTNESNSWNSAFNQYKILKQDFLSKVESDNKYTDMIEEMRTNLEVWQSELINLAKQTGLISNEDIKQATVEETKKLLDNIISKPDYTLIIISIVIVGLGIVIIQSILKK
jgi:hypothetical protein